jgi:2,3-bisphosphoglycerate-dependent phosphoglycerate mutase
MEVLLIRHGDAAGDPHRHFEPPVEGCLSHEGESQAARLARRLEEIPIDAFYASPLGRAIQTAQPLARAQGRMIQVLPWLEEWRPAHILHGGDPAEYEAMQASAAELPVEQTWKTEAGESLMQMADRVIPGFLELMKNEGVHAAHGGWVLEERAADRRMALFGHGGTLGLLASFILGMPLRPDSRIAFGKTGVARFEWVRRGDVWYPLLRLDS